MIGLAGRYNLAMPNAHAMAELKRKQHEIVGAIRSYEAQIAQAKHDLEHVNATMKILEGGDANRRTYIAGRGFFDKGEVADIAVRHLAAEGEPLTTRELVERVMAGKSLEVSDTSVRNSVVYKVVQALRHAQRRNVVGMVEKRGGMCVWATRLDAAISRPVSG